MKSKWKIYDPNGAYIKENGTNKGYRPIYINEGNKQLFYVGNASEDKNVLKIANIIIEAVNAKV